MYLKAIFLGLVVTVGFSNLARADEPPSDNVFVHSVQCEAGRIGDRMRRAGLPQNLKVAVTWRFVRTTSEAGGLGLTFPFFNFGGSGDLSMEQINRASSEGLAFNLHPENLAVCRGFRKDIVAEGVGLYDCLINRKFTSLQAAIAGGAGTAGCELERTFKKKASGNLRLNVWGVDVGPSGSWGDAHTFSFVVAAPKRN